MKKITHKWFPTSLPTNANYASAQIGAGADGVVTIVSDTLGTEENHYSISASVAAGNSAPLSVSKDGTRFYITLGTDVAGDPDDAKNTATLVAAAVSGLDGVSATASGTGATPFAEAVEIVLFTGGTYATVTHEPAYMLAEGTIYMTEVPVGRYDTDKWKTGSLATL